MMVARDDDSSGPGDGQQRAQDVEVDGVVEDHQAAIRGAGLQPAAYFSYGARGLFARVAQAERLGEFGQPGHSLAWLLGRNPGDERPALVDALACVFGGELGLAGAARPGQGLHHRHLLGRRDLPEYVGSQLERWRPLRYVANPDRELRRGS
jgi:hypothetical protein